MFICNIDSISWIILKFCTERGSYTAMLCAKFQNDTTIDKSTMNQSDFLKFELMLIFPIVCRP